MAVIQALALTFRPKIRRVPQRKLKLLIPAFLCRFFTRIKSSLPPTVQGPLLRLNTLFTPPQGSLGKLDALLTPPPVQPQPPP